MMRLVGKADPEAIVLDTETQGRPDLLALALREVRRWNVEAVFVMGNVGVVRRVVGGLEGRGVVAFGPIWDS
jgi:hypothetical protein